MARASARLVVALRETADRLRRAEITYQWSRFAHCNCGHLAQTITGLAPSVIEAAARRQSGDWAQQAHAVVWPGGAEGRPDEGAIEPESIDRCNVTQRSMTEIMAALSEWGLAPADVDALEHLNDSAVRRRLGKNTVDFPHGDRHNVIAYMNAWAELLEEGLTSEQRDAVRCHGADYPLAAE